MCIQPYEPRQTNGRVFTDILHSTTCTPAQFAKCRTEAHKSRRMMAAKVCERGFCVKHMQACEYHLDDIVIGGSPCVDWSMAGKRRRTNGPSFQLWLAQPLDHQ